MGQYGVECPADLFGAGGVGTAAIAVAAALGASPLIAVDIKPDKLALAEHFGATHTIDASREDPITRIREIVGGSGADLTVEAAGRPDVMEQAFASTRLGGGLCLLAGNVPLGQRMSLDPYDLIKGRRIAGTWAGETVPERDFPIYAKMAADGRLDLAAMVSHEYGLSQINQALDDLEAGRVARALVRLQAT